MGTGHAVRKAIVIILVFARNNSTDWLHSGLDTMKCTMKWKAENLSTQHDTYSATEINKTTDEKLQMRFIYPFIHSGSNAITWPLPCGLINVQWSAVSVATFTSNQTIWFKTSDVSGRQRFGFACFDIMSPLRHSCRLSRSSGNEKNCESSNERNHSTADLHLTTLCSMERFHSFLFPLSFVTSEHHGFISTVFLSVHSISFHFHMIST